jgi:peptidoglycan/xylan/chitin deacetylase (PgdA/CDA1 family)
MRLVGALWAFLFSVTFAAPLLGQTQHGCDPSKGIGVGRTIDIDTRGGPWFGAPFGNPDILAPGEVVLTFDDGPLPHSTPPILRALAAECTKATFFIVGQMAAAHPHIVREIAVQGHTIGTHTWSHANLRLVSDGSMRAQIESAFAQVEKAADRPIAPFFRYPYLSSSPATVAYLQGRDIAQVSVDIDSLDYLLRNAQRIVRQVMAQLERRGRGIVLLHDIHASTALAVPGLLVSLKEKGYKIAHLRPTTAAQTQIAWATPPKSLRSAHRQRRDAMPAKTQNGGGWVFKWPFW